jgi:alginate O-acetyltransferase complex protein AlgI
MVLPDALSLSDAMRWQVSGWGIFVLGLSFLLLYLGPRVNSRAAVASGETEPPILKNALLWVPLFLLAVLRLSAQSYTPFLYFQF